ncbi:MAG: ATP-binding protein, partial [Propionibacterium sp.]|nr:ATP-binding protein [Propionibacterium sp.]
AVDTFVKLGIIDETGAMDGESVEIGNSKITLTQGDVRKLQLAKAAIAAGIDTLISESAVGENGLSALHLAGGFGSYLQAEPAAGIGLIPRPLARNADPAGNTSLTGAVLLTLSRKARKVSEELAAKAHEVELSTNPVWNDSYIDNMAFPKEDDD